MTVTPMPGHGSPRTRPRAEEGGTEKEGGGGWALARGRHRSHLSAQAADRTTGTETHGEGTQSFSVL